MRVLLAVHAFPPRSTAGVEAYTLRLARALAAREHDVLVLTAVHDLAAAPYSVRRRMHEGVSVVEIVNVHHHGTLERTYSDPDVDRAVAPVLREFRPECVHVQHLLNLSCGLIAAARAQGARVVLTLHDYWLSCARDGLRMREDLALCTSMDHNVCATCMTSSPYLVPPLQRGLAGAARGLGFGRYLHRLHDVAPRAAETMLRALRSASPPDAKALAAAFDRRAETLRAALSEVDVFLAPTAFVAARAVEFGIASAKVRLFPYGVLVKPPSPRPARTRRRFGFIGTLAPHKGVHVLIEAFRGLSVPEATLNVFGSLAVQPAYVAQLRRAAEGDARIRFHGPFAEGGQERALASIDVLVVPSVWWENSPLTVLEALGAGVPVIAARTGGVPELVPEGVGLLVPPGDVAAWREALTDVAAGRRLAEAREPVVLKTAADEARELEAFYRR